MLRHFVCVNPLAASMGCPLSLYKLCGGNKQHETAVCVSYVLLATASSYVRVKWRSVTRTVVVVVATSIAFLEMPRNASQTLKGRQDSKQQVATR